jgi:CubicO group peptidase (beta-lactamase class C family)
MPFARFLLLSSLFILLSSLFSSCQVGRFVAYNVADINDYKKFPSRPLERADHAFEFYDDGRKLDSMKATVKGKKISFDEFQEKNKTVGFLIIRKDSILYERYFKGYDRTKVVPSFSVAKSVISILIGCAIEDGYISSVDESITTYIPELSERGMDKVTIKHLLQMTSGIKFSESYINPFGHAAAYYYGRNLRKQIFKMKLKEEPGTKFHYKSGDTQVLGLLLERALKTKTITDYLQEKIWTPLGMEYDASWSIDRKENGLEKTFCCLNAVALDFAKIGRLYLNDGNWNGRQIVPETWVRESIRRDTSDGSAAHYQYQWWLVSDQGDYMAQGILGQYVYIHPEKDLIIVRLGKNYSNVGWSNVFTSIASAFPDTEN